MDVEDPYQHAISSSAWWDVLTGSAADFNTDVSYVGARLMGRALVDSLRLVLVAEARARMKLHGQMAAHTRVVNDPLIRDSGETEHNNTTVVNP